MYRVVLAIACAEADDLERCGQLLEAEAAAGFPIPDDGNWTTALQYWAEAAVLTRNVEAAEVLLDRISPTRELLVTTHVTASPVLAHTVGRLQHFLGLHEESNDSFERALQLHEGLRSPLYVCTTQAAWAALLADRDHDDDRVRASAMAAEAREAACNGGYQNVELEATRVLEQIA